MPSCMGIKLEAGLAPLDVKGGASFKKLIRHSAWKASYACVLLFPSTVPAAQALLMLETALICFLFGSCPAVHPIQAAAIFTEISGS